MQAGLTNANAEPLRRDVEVGTAATSLLTQLLSLSLVFLWRHVAAFRWSRGLVRDSHGGDPVGAPAPVAGVVHHCIHANCMKCNGTLLRDVAEQFLCPMEPKVQNLCSEPPGQGHSEPHHPYRASPPIFCQIFCHRW